MISSMASSRLFRALDRIPGNCWQRPTKKPLSLGSATNTQSPKGTTVLVGCISGALLNRCHIAEVIQKHPPPIQKQWCLCRVFALADQPTGPQTCLALLLHMGVAEPAQQRTIRRRVCIRSFRAAHAAGPAVVVLQRFLNPSAPFAAPTSPQQYKLPGVL